jgi:hypothetical protein
MKLRVLVVLQTPDQRFVAGIEVVRGAKEFTGFDQEILEQVKE